MKRLFCDRCDRQDDEAFVSSDGKVVILPTLQVWERGRGVSLSIEVALARDTRDFALCRSCLGQLLEEYKQNLLTRQDLRS